MTDWRLVSEQLNTESRMNQSWWVAVWPAVTLESIWRKAAAATQQVQRLAARKTAAATPQVRRLAAKKTAAWWPVMARKVSQRPGRWPPMPNPMWTRRWQSLDQAVWKPLAEERERAHSWLWVL